MKITHYINRPDADDILVDVEVTIGDDDKGLTFTSEDVGTVAQPHERYRSGEVIQLTKSERKQFEEYAAEKMADRKERDYEKEEDFDL